MCKVTEDKDKNKCQLCPMKFLKIATLKVHIKNIHRDTATVKNVQRKTSNENPNVPDLSSKSVRIDNTFTMNFEIKEEDQEFTKLKQEVKKESC